MPYPNEHAIRLRDPKDFAAGTFRRTRGSGKAKVQGTKIPKTIHVIWAKLKGKAGDDDPVVAQSLRFPTKDWTVEKAKEWKKTHNIRGKFEAAKPKTNEEEGMEDVDLESLSFLPMDRIVTNLEAGEYKYTEFQGVEYLVVPGVILVEGVHNGYFYPVEEIEKWAEEWNGVPVPVHHPKDDEGNYISAQIPEVLMECAGRIWNTTFDPEISGLRTEFWIDTTKVGKDVQQEIIDGKMEVSTGLFADHEIQQGDWHGEAYQAILRNFTPDHVAILPGGIGACSWEDGCGIRVNENNPYSRKEVEHTVKDEKSVEKERALKTNEASEGNGDGMVKAFLKTLAEKVGFRILEPSHEDIRRKISSELQKKFKADSDGYVDVWVREVFDKYCIYEREDSLWKQSYTLDANDMVEFVGDPLEVVLETKYVPVVRTVAAEKQKQVTEPAEKADEDTTAVEETMEVNEEGTSEKTFEKQEEDMDKEKVVDALIEGTQFEESDREWLMGLEETQLDKITKSTQAAEKTETETVEEDKTTEPAVAEEKASTTMTVEEYLANSDMPDEVKAVLINAMEEQKTRKDNLVQSILANERNKFTEDQLRGKGLDELRVIASMIEVDEAQDYTLNAGGQSEREINPNERQPDGTGVPPVPVPKWNPDGTPILQ